MPEPPTDSPPRSTKRQLAAANHDRLKLYFAILTCLGGIILASGEGAETIPVIAVFFGVFGYVFVDRLKLFALPPMVAYILMGIAAVYCVSDFWDLDTPGNRQMLSVAQLLVMVQAILMLQEKTPRIFEQLGVFCLLQLVVAAVFNDAVIYGLLLLPIGLIGVWALALLSSVTASEGLDVTSVPAEGTGGNAKAARTAESWGLGASRPAAASMRFSAVESVVSLAGSMTSLGRFVIVTLVPAMLFVGAIFFYALPRTTDAARMDGRAGALVGFDDEMRLEQIGRMLQSSDPAVRVRLEYQGTARPYTVISGLYLRGQVLEHYESDMRRDKPVATWSSLFAGASMSREFLPAEFIPSRMTDTNFYDSIHVEVTCEPMQSPSLFAIAPYFRTKFEDGVTHAGGRWTLARRDQAGFYYPRMRYEFGTHAFRDGVQTDMIAAPRGVSLAYRRELLRFDQLAMPTIARMAADIRGSLPRQTRNDYSIARAFERHLAVAGGYDYTLNLNAQSIKGTDPIEQFMSVDRRGHCQYFASAMAMMLRSVGIPARVVVGYRTEDFSEIGQYYLARQSHAHAWVEALLRKDQLSSDRLVYGQPEARQYWVRFDPTPGGGGAIRSGAGGVDQVFSFARDIWDELVVEMDGERQNRVLNGGDPMAESYGSFIGWIQQRIAMIRAGGLGGGSLALRDVFSWRGAMGAAIAVAALIVLTRLRLPGWFRRRRGKKSDLVPDKPAIPFYAETLKQLSRLGLSRTINQSPTEFSHIAGKQLKRWGDTEIGHSLQVLTKEFCRQRYGDPAGSTSDTAAAVRQLKVQVDQLLARPGFTQP